MCVCVSVICVCVCVCVCYVCVCVLFVSSQLVGNFILNDELDLICLQTVKQFQVLLFNINNSVYQLFIYDVINFAHSCVVSSYFFYEYLVNDLSIL